MKNTVKAVLSLIALAAWSARAEIECGAWGESAAMRFESRDWAEAVWTAATNSPSIAIEGGRLQSNTVWGPSKTHLVFNTVYVPSGVTLSVTTNAVVKFCPGTMIKVEDGGKLNVAGMSGGDVVFTAANDDAAGEVVGGFADGETISFGGIRLQSSAAAFSDNGRLELRGFSYGAFPSVTVNDTEAVRNGGMAYVQFTLSGASRSAAFSVDWEAVEGTAKFGDDYTLAHGTVSWSGTSQGTRTLTIPLNAANATGEERSFKVRISAARCANVARREATVKIVERDGMTLEWADGWTESDPSIRFESRDWAEAVWAAATNNAAIAVEGGRLTTNAVWRSDKTHLVFNTVYVPSGVTLSVTTNAVVKFCPGTTIKVEDGGRLSVEGMSGGDVILTAANDDTAGEVVDGFADGEKMTFGGIRLQSSAATFSDNGWLQTRGFTWGAYPNVSLNDAVAFRSSGLASIPVTISGTTRNQSFTVDWVAEDGTAKLGADYTLASGRLTWAKSGDGTKTITIPLVADHLVGSNTTFKIRLAVSRGANVARGECTVTIKELDSFDVEGGAWTESAAIRFESRDWAEAVWTAATNNAAIAIEGGRLLTNTVWRSDKTHLVFNTVYVPSGVTLSVTTNAVVKFCPGTTIKVEDGGKLSVAGTSGGDVILTAANDDTAGEVIGGFADGETISFGGIRLQSSAAAFSDNGWLQTRGFTYGAFPTIRIHDAVANRADGRIYLAVTVGGSTRNQAFTADWVATDDTAKMDEDYTRASGRISWSKSGDGTKYIIIPLVKGATEVGTNRAFTVTLATVRGANAAVASATATVREYSSGGIETDDVVEWAPGDPSDAFAVNEGVGAQPLFLSDVETIQYSGKWQTYDAEKARKLRVTLETDNGVTLLKETTPDDAGAFDLRLADWPVGYYTLRHEIEDGYGEVFATMSKTFSIADRDDVELHGGTLTRNETWGADKVHVVYQTVVVPSVYTLFIEPGAIVKFLTGTGIDISSGGALFANRIVFTHINDDTVGGDTLNDGYTVAPPMDAYTLSGAFTFGDDTELRGITQNTALSGTISGAKTLSRGSTYRVSGTLTVASGGSLTIPPGTVLKMEAGASIVVNSGATLNAAGTRAAPIVITSIKDDAYSGDTNGDGGKTWPQPGDWARIYAGGAVNMDYCTIRYCNNNSDYGAIHGTGGTVTFDNSIIEYSVYECVRMNSGRFIARNSVFRESSMGFGYYGGSGVDLYNCIVADCTIGCRAANKRFHNTVFYRCITFLESTASRCDHCVFYNPPDYGAQTAVQVGTSGNVWGDPLFVDPDGGDFRVVEGSPCVDAADPATAPEFDYYGQPRITITGGSPSPATDGGTSLTNETAVTGAALPDIGICEVMPRDVTSDIDLVPQSVRTDATATPGQLLFVKWEVANRGGAAVEAAWRDAVSLVSASGREVALGDKTTTSRIAVGGSVFCSAYFTVPAMAEGTWYPKVNVNAYHDIFEGSLAANNALVSETPVEVAAVAVDPAVSREGVVNPGSPTVIKLPFGEADENRMVAFDLPAGVTVTWGFGFMPTRGTGILPVQSGTALSTGSSPVRFRVPDGATDVYVILESDAAATYELSTESTKMTVSGVSPATLPASGTATLTVSGAGFGEGCAIALSGASAGRVVIDSPRLDASGALVATVDCAALKSGATYDLTVENGDASATLPSAVYVTKAQGKGHFWYELSLPETGRKGRPALGVLRYGNSGNANMFAPIVDVVSCSDGLLSRENPVSWVSSLRFVAIGKGENPALLSPDEECRINFLVMSGDENSFALYCSEGKHLKTDWQTQSEFEKDLYEAAYRVGFAGGDASDYECVYALAKALARGTNDNAIGGTVRGSAGDLLPNAQIDLYRIDGDETNKISTVRSSPYGRFVFNYLEDGFYLMGVAGCMLEDEVITLDNGLFISDIRISARTERIISVRPMGLSDDVDHVSVTLTSILKPSLVYHPLMIDDDGRYLFDSSISNGYYRVHCSCGNLEGFDGLYVDDASEIDIEVAMSAPAIVSGRVEGMNEHSLPDTEVVLSMRGNASGRTYMAFPDAASGEFSIGEMVADTYVITYSGLTCSYEADTDLEFGDGETCSLIFRPVSTERKMTVEYPASFDNHLLVVAGPEGILTAESLDGSGSVEVPSVSNGRWSFVVVSENGTQVASASFELSDDNRVCQIEDVKTPALMSTSISAKNSPPVRLRGLGGWLADKFKALTHWLGEALANALPISIMDFFETKEWKEGIEISNAARSYLNTHTRIGYPGPCCCGYNDQKHPFDKAALDGFVQQVNSFSTYVQSCSSMKVVASTSKSIADVADNIGEQVICSYTGGLLNKMVQINNIRVRFVALAAYVKAAKDLGEDYAKLQEELKKLQSSWDAVVFTLEHGGTWMQFEANVSRLTEYITQWSVGKRNYYSHSNKVFAAKLDEFGKVLKDIAIVIEAVRDIYEAGKEIDQMHRAVDQFPSRKAQFLQQYAYFQAVAGKFGYYHKGDECKPEKWPNPEYEPPFDGPYPYPRVVLSYDPNEMAGPVGLGDPETERFVKPGEWLTYTVYFENKSDATAAAQEVSVVNPLSEWLDWSTFEMGEIAFNNQIDLGLSGKRSGTSEATMTGTNFIVRTTLTLEGGVAVNQAGGSQFTATGTAADAMNCVPPAAVAKWYLRIVDPTTSTGWPEDILAGFLPPNDETFRGEGHLTYRVKVRDDAPAGAVITNSASIVFDYNDPIETDPAWWNTVAPSVGTARFAETEISVDEGTNAVVRISGGDVYTNSSVKVYLTYNTAAAADVDLGGAQLVATSDAGGRPSSAAATGLKFPLVLKWDAGEVGEKTIAIPVKADALVEGEEIFTLQLAGASGMDLGAERICTVRIADAQWREGMTPEETAAWGQAALPAGAVIFYETVDGAAAPAGYYALDKKKANATAKALPGWKFVGWVYDSNGKTYSTKATITEKLRKSKKVHPKFVRAAYVRALVDDPATGTVKGGANVQIGKTATLTATPKKGYAFTGWYMTGRTGFQPVQGGVGNSTETGKDARSPSPLSLATTYKHTVGEDGGTLVATFKKESELARPVLTLDDGAGVVATDAANGNATNFLSVGVAYSVTLKVVGESKVSITKVAGLPKGLAYKGGKITGVPTAKASATVAVTVALASNKKKVWTYRLPFAVAALPEWARGQFAGTVTLGRAASPLAADDDETRRDEDIAPYQGDDAGGSQFIATGTDADEDAINCVPPLTDTDADAQERVPPGAAATLTVGTTGKVSGKFALGGTNWTFSAASFARESVVTGEVARFVVRTTAKGSWKVKSGKKTVTKTVTAPFGFALVADPETSDIAAKSVDGYFGAATDETEAGAVEFRRNAGVRVTKAGAAAGGAVSLSVALGQAASNRTVKAVATLKKGYAFVGWYLGAGGSQFTATGTDADAMNCVPPGDTDADAMNCIPPGDTDEDAMNCVPPVSLALSYTVKMTGEDVFLVAAFKKEADLARPVLTLDDGIEARASEASGGIAATNLTVGVAYAAALKASGEAAVTVVKVTGLPAGLKYAGGRITGVPTAAKTVAATVTVALSTNRKKTWTYRPRFTVGALPAWAVGTFTGTLVAPAGERRDGGIAPYQEGDSDGRAASPLAADAGADAGRAASPLAAEEETPLGTVTLTVGKTGKVSGKFTDVKKASAAFSAASFTSFADGVLRAKSSLKYGRKTYAVSIAVGRVADGGADAADGDEAGASDGEAGVNTAASAGVAEVVVTIGGETFGEAVLSRR